MIYSSACEYALRAMSYLVEQGSGARVLARDVSSNENIPGPFLGKIFQTLVKGGLLMSTKGPGGGFRLARDPKTITLFDIRAVIDGVGDLDGCAAGLAACSDEEPCPLHDTWKPIRAQIRAYLEKTDLAQMAAAVKRKRNLTGAQAPSGAPPIPPA